MEISRIISGIFKNLPDNNQEHWKQILELAT